MKLNVKEMTLCGLFAALIAIGAFLQIQIPLPLYTMHFTLQWFFVLVVSLLLGAKIGTISVLVYLCIGLVGVPVFAAGGGPSYVLRPGFGFLLGFLLAAFVMGTLVDRYNFRKLYQLSLVSVAGLVIYYTVGAIYFYLIKNLYVGEAVSFSVVVVNYCLITVVPDLILCLLSVLVTIRLQGVVRNLVLVENN